MSNEKDVEALKKEFEEKYGKLEAQVADLTKERDDLVKTKEELETKAEEDKEKIGILSKKNSNSESKILETLQKKLQKTEDELAVQKKWREDLLDKKQTEIASDVARLKVQAGLATESEVPEMIDKLKKHSFEWLEETRKDLRDIVMQNEYLGTKTTPKNIQAGLVDPKERRRYEMFQYWRDADGKKKY
jgi:chromosome segregation ATPase